MYWAHVYMKNAARKLIGRVSYSTLLVYIGMRGPN